MTASADRLDCASLSASFVARRAASVAARTRERVIGGDRTVGKLGAPGSKTDTVDATDSMGGF